MFDIQARRTPALHKYAYKIIFPWRPHSMKNTCFSVNVKRQLFWYGFIPVCVLAPMTQEQSSVSQKLETIMLENQLHCDEGILP